FDFCGIARADFLEEEAPRLERWLRLGKHGEMAYMNNWFDKRLDPRKLVDGAKSVICLMQNYYTDQVQTDPEAPRIAKYARGKDYHWVLKQKLFSIVDKLRADVGDFNFRVFVDSGPVLEKAWAAKAGLGWIGKNSLLLTREHGSFYFLCEIIVDFDLDYDRPITDFCANCRKCQDACPTGALVEPRILDARRCISYFTIEYRGDLPLELRDKFDNWMFGCDICQDVCPWNRKSIPHYESLFNPDSEMLNKSKTEWQEITRDVYNRLFRDTAVTRTRFEGLKRNIKFLTALPAAGNSQEKKDGEISI
ncbi:MAG: tRNA epoxyqueuosine(34) reductase QueG, partial [Candidatus Zixiibacteriota bacterium]